VYDEEVLQVYRDYQSKVHKEKKEKEPSDFKKFLCNVPLFDSNATVIPPECTTPQEVRAYKLEQRLGCDRKFRDND